MNNTQCTYLLHLARTSIASYLETGMRNIPSKPEDPQLSEERAVFITLTKNESLRGCIGHLKARDPLYKAVSEMAIAAATEDSRFPRVTLHELDQLQISISILSPLSRIHDWQQIKLGIDGVWVMKGYQNGVFLPQVATETGWDLETFLQHLCRDKAGLSLTAYKDEDTQLYIFQVDKIEDPEST
jgi:AmmeMemoRadiSam system protein A